MDSVFTDLTQKVSIAHTAVVVIDMQNDFCAEGGLLSRRGIDTTATSSMIPRLQQFLKMAREKQVKTIFIQMVTSEDDLSPPIMERLTRIGIENRACAKGSWGAEFIPEIQPKAGEEVVTKTRYSAFINTNFDKQLRDMDVKTLIITGVATNICVESTSRDGYMLDYYIVVPEDMVACSDEKLQQISMWNLGHYFATITTSKEILQAWEHGDEKRER